MSVHSASSSPHAAFLLYDQTGTLVQSKWDKSSKENQTGHKGKKEKSPLSGGDPYDITLIRLNQVSLDRRRREKVNWEMITEHSCNPFANLEAGMLEQFSTHP